MGCARNTRTDRASPRDEKKGVISSGHLISKGGGSRFQRGEIRADDRQYGRESQRRGKRERLSGTGVSEGKKKVPSSEAQTVFRSGDGALRIGRAHWRIEPTNA